MLEGAGGDFSKWVGKKIYYREGYEIFSGVVDSFPVGYMFYHVPSGQDVPWDVVIIGTDGTKHILAITEVYSDKDTAVKQLIVSLEEYIEEENYQLEEIQKSINYKKGQLEKYVKVLEESSNDLEELKNPYQSSAGY